MYHALDEEVFLAPETIIWNTLRTATAWQEDQWDEDEPYASERFDAEFDKRDNQREPR